MPRRNSLISRLRHGRAWDEWDEKGDGEEAAAAPASAGTRPRSRRRRVVVAVTFASLFVAGAAFSAAAGDEVRSTLEGTALSSAAASDGATADATTPDATTPDGTTTDGTTTDGTAPTVPDPGAVPAPADDSDLSPAGDATGDSGDSAAPDTAVPPAAAPVGTPAASAAATAAVEQAATSSASASTLGPGNPVASTRASQRKFVGTTRARAHHFPEHTRVARAPAPELEGAASAVVWLNRALPDPTPPALRLSPRFARHLRSVARADHVSWALMLGVLRAEGHNGAAPAGLAGLRDVAAHMPQAGIQKSSPWAAMFSFSRDTSFADRAVALSHYYRAVGLRALVNGLVAEKGRLGKKVLNDPRVSIYAGGRGDIESGRVNVRVLAAIEYLADSFGQVTVSCLISGHRLYARPGVISAHIYGLAADISEVGGMPIFGHQQPGGITERAVRDMLLLPPELMPKQVISLLGLGGPSFPLANHYDHIHIGY